MDHHQHQQSRKQMASPEVAMANEVFDQFCNATTLKSILGHFRHLCDLLKIKPTHFHQFYPKLKSKLRSWKAQALWKKFDQRANHKCYNRGKACLNTRVLIIGGGPCGMRSAIEAQLLGAKVVVVEKRDRMSRNNVLHLWPFVIQDLRALGAKKFFGKFCAGSIDHISIRQLQCILLKVALILGVEFHESVSFEKLVPPPDNQEDGKIGWRAKTIPADHPVSQYEFDVLIGADGKRNTLEGFKRKEFRGKLAIAITANFINKRTEAEARVEEISGVAFIFNQKFFKELYSETGIDLENIVYYKDDTHYFVMTAKKHSLIDKGVILQDHADTAKLLAKENVDREALMLYAREAAEFSTEYQMMDMEFAVNHYGQPDVAMFDFTSMYAAENASRVLERRGHRLLMILVGDSLLEPFWPTGSGCARGFLSSLDACWAIKGWGGALTPLEVIAERESIYRLLGQTTPENLNRDYAAYTLDPHTRYPNLNVRSVTTVQIRSLLDTDDPETFKLLPVQAAIDLPKKRRRRDSQVHPDTLLHWLQRQVALYDGVRIQDMGTSFKSGLAIAAIIHRYRPDLIDYHSLKKDDPVTNNQIAFDILEKELGIPPIMTGEEMAQCDVPDKLTMFSYLTQIYEAFRGEIPHIKHPKLEPETEDRPPFSQKLNELTAERKAQLLGRLVKQDTMATRARRSRHINENLPLPGDKKGDTLTRRHARKRRSTEKMGATVDREPKIHAGHHRGSVDEGFSGRIRNFEEKLKGTTSTEKKPKDLLRAIGKIEKTDWNVKEIEKKIEENKMGRGVRHDRVERVPKWSREQFLARQTKMEKKGREPMETDSKYAEIDSTLKSIDRKIKEGNVLGHNKVSAMAEQFANKNQDAAAADQPKVQRSNSKAAVALPAQGGSEMCHFCEKRVYLMERLTAEGKSFHRGCFRCEYCSTSLRIGNHTFDRDKNGGRFYCTQHFGLPGTMKTRIEKKKVPLTNKENIPQSSNNLKTPEKGKIPLEGISGLDLLDRGQTPERIEFENLAGISDTEEAHSIMDEDEWTDRNFGPSAAEMGSSDDISDMSDSDDDNEVFEEAIDQPLTTEGTLELAKNWTLRYSHPHPAAANSDTGSNEYEISSDEYTSTEEESQTATEDEEDVRARELRKKEVWLQVPPRNSDTETGSETEVKQSQNTTNNECNHNSVDQQVLPPIEITVAENNIDLDNHANGLESVSVDLENGVVSRPENLISQTEVTKPNEPALILIEEINISPIPLVSLPDAIPIYESESGSQKSLEVIGILSTGNSNGNNNLPDLITSSPKLSRQSSLLSDTQSFASLEDLSIKDEDNTDKSLSVVITSPDTSWLEVEEVLNKSDSTDDKPVLMVTAPTPTSERPPESPLIESTKLVVPKEKTPTHQERQRESPTSFDNLLQELRQRKAKNKAEAEAKESLKPLATETAKLHMSKYFDTKKKESKTKEETKVLKKQESVTKNDDESVVELQVKSKVSGKVDKKDLLKYFSGSSFDNKSKPKIASPIIENIEKMENIKNDDSEKKILDEFTSDDLDIDDIEKEFNEIEKQNKNNLELLESVDINNCLSKSDFDLFDNYLMNDFDIITDALGTEIEKDTSMDNFKENKDDFIKECLSIDTPSENSLEKTATFEEKIHNDYGNLNDYSIQTVPEVITELNTLTNTKDYNQESNNGHTKSNGYSTHLDNKINRPSESITNKTNICDKELINGHKHLNGHAVDLTPNKVASESFTDKTNSCNKTLNDYKNINDKTLPETNLASEASIDKKLNGDYKTVNVNSTNSNFKTATTSETLTEKISNNNCGITNGNSIEPISKVTIASKILTDKNLVSLNNKASLSSASAAKDFLITKQKESKKSTLSNRSDITPQSKSSIKKIVVKEQELLPIKITEIKAPEKLKAYIESQVETLSTTSDSTPKKPGRRRVPESNNLSLSQPTSPVALVRGNKSDLRKSLSIRLRKHSGSESSNNHSGESTPKSTASSTLPIRKNGLLSRKSDVHGSFKSVDSSSRAKKEKCVIS